MSAAENAESEVSSDSDEVIVVSDAEASPNKANVPLPEFNSLATEQPGSSKAPANTEGPSTAGQIAPFRSRH